MTIRHHRVKRQLDAYVDDELAPTQGGRVLAHLDECPECSAHVRLLLRIRASLRRRDA